MSVEFNKFRNYKDYNFAINQDAGKKAEKEEASKEVEQNSTAVFKGLENETDLLTKNTQNLYNVQLTKFSAEDLSMADETNQILASLGVKNYKVTPAQVASVANGVNAVVLPGLKLAEEGAIKAHIADPNGPFADLFA